MDVQCDISTIIFPFSFLRFVYTNVTVTGARLYNSGDDTQYQSDV